MSSGLCLALEGLSLKKIPTWEEPLQKSQFHTENSLKMSHFRPTSRRDAGCLQVSALLWSVSPSKKKSKLGGASPKVSIPYRKFFYNDPLQTNFKGKGPGRAPECHQAFTLLRKVRLSKTKMQLGRSLSKTLNSLQRILLK